MVESVFIRNDSFSVPEEEPEFARYRNLAVTEDENGNRHFEECPPVAPSLASDFSVIENALLNKRDIISPDRVVCDPVDVESKFPETFEQLNSIEDE